jgi:hypothetical protein
MLLLSFFYFDSLDVDGLESAVSIPVLGPRVATSFEDDFLLNFTKTTLAKLVGLAEDGIYVVSASVVDLVDPEEWWYPSCRCHRSLTADSGAYYCKFCVKHVFKMVPRFGYFFISMLILLKLCKTLFYM